MLVLARQRDETIMIGEDISVTIVDIRGDKVRLGINAPKNVQVHRQEVFDAIRRENRAASQLRPEDIALPRGKFNDEQLAQLRSSALFRAAVEQAKLGLAEGGLPIGSVLARGDEIIAAGHNRRVQDGAPMAHAEIDCLTRAGRQTSYADWVLYSTLMPCYLCSGAVVQFGIKKVVVGESVNFAGGPEFMRKHGVEIVDLRDPECIQMMGDFIKAHPQLWHEDIGK